MAEYLEKIDGMKKDIEEHENELKKLNLDFNSKKLTEDEYQLQKRDLEDILTVLKDMFNAINDEYVQTKVDVESLTYVWTINFGR